MTESATVFYRSIHMDTPSEKGWDFVTGDPELWKFSDRLLKPKGKVLDVGIGGGRASLFFALHGMEVEGYDLDPEYVTIVNGYREVIERIDPNFDLNIKASNIDFLDAPVVPSTFDIALLSQTFIHSDSKATAYKILDKTFDAVKSGGYIWIRAIGKEDYSLGELFHNWERRARQQDADVVKAYCTCSGRVQHDPFLFFDQHELLQYFCFKGAGIIHSQVVPQYHRSNVMFGEDWFNDESSFNINGQINILAQRVS